MTIITFFLDFNPNLLIFNIKIKELEGSIPATPPRGGGCEVIKGVDSERPIKIRRQPKKVIYRPLDRLCRKIKSVVISFPSLFVSDTFLTTRAVQCLAIPGAARARPLGAARLVWTCRRLCRRCCARRSKGCGVRASTLARCCCHAFRAILRALVNDCKTQHAAVC